MTEKKATKKNPYTGKAGHLAVMGELCWRGYNVALPEIDTGDDIFSVDDGVGTMLRIQVKTAKAKRYSTRPACKYEFKVKMKAIRTIQHPALHFVFACRVEHGFRFVVMSRDVLENYVSDNVGSPGDRQGEWRRFDITICDDNTVECSGRDWTRHLENWEPWPIILGLSLECERRKRAT